MSGTDWEPDPESLQNLGAEIREALVRYRQARGDYHALLGGRQGGPDEIRRIPKDVNLGPSPVNPYVGSPPPLWTALPERRPNESPYDWIRRCGVAALNAAISVLATEEGWQVVPLPGPPGMPEGGGWRVHSRGQEEWIDIRPGNVCSAMPWVKT